MQRFTQGFYGYVVAVAVCFGLVGIFLLIAPQSREEHIPRVDYSMDIANLGRAAPYTVWAPSAPTANWVPTSSRMTTEKGTHTWRLGFATAKRAHAMLVQSDEKPADKFASRLANSEAVVGKRDIAGATWEERFRKDKDQRSLVRFLPDATLIVTGTADWDELSTLAASLKQQPKPTT
ncbi:DUF4245 domain-containing protein [Sinosporangium siamense]|uniref:DUF4245 domain-containing protein n=1 Tax=Sinosporangium siamense TaxID=1367973 RepID=A0A919RJQ1_9ACTN|nr:DUF4245 domain-containing protein [Sinosporangium siamense]GII93159.1 hypothetical protein Ssi02_33900 [Sinosporangium siamense]